MMTATLTYTIVLAAIYLGKVIIGQKDWPSRKELSQIILVIPGSSLHCQVSLAPNRALVHLKTSQL